MVCLTAAPDAFDNETIVDSPWFRLGPPQPGSEQSYDLPPSLDLRSFAAVTVWSELHHRASAVSRGITALPAGIYRRSGGMDVVRFGQHECGKILRYLDSYISNELLIETNHEVLRHLDNCPACAAEAEDRARLRAMLREAVEGQAVAPGLEGRIKERIRRRKAGVPDRGSGYPG